MEQRGARPGGLPRLPPSVWQSWEVRAAVAAENPGTVIAIARRAHGLRQDELGTLAGFSQSAISRLESGSNLAYDTRILRTLQKLLGIPPQLLGLSEPVGRGQPPALVETPIPGRVLGNTAGLGLLAGGPPATNGPIAPELVGNLLVARRIVNDAHNWRGSPALKPAVLELYQLADRLRRAAHGSLRRDMLRVAALYAEFYGWLHEEAGDLAGAGRWTGRALEQGQAADDRDLVAYAYVRMSQLAEADGDADRVVGLARAARREDGVGLRVRAIALQQEARGLARAGNEAACLSRLDEAATLIDRFEPMTGDEYQIGYCYTRHHLALQRAACLLMLDRPHDAVAAYQLIRPGWGPVCLWEQGVHTAKLAYALAVCGDFEQAAAVGFEALSLTDQGTGSALVGNELRRLDRWSGVPALTDLAEAVATVC